jgi:ribokinase
VVTVFGSINQDLVCRVAHLPAPGETVAGSSFAMFPGGKGANQALAAARAGAKTRLFGAVGNDAFAGPATSLLARSGVDIDGVARVDAPTGVAIIQVDDHGENCIVVVAGANAQADPDAVPDAALASPTVLVLQQEVAAAANASLIARARHLGARIVLNAAPAHPVPFELLRMIDILVVNELEAAALGVALGWAATPLEFGLSARCEAPDMTVVITLGAAGALWVDPHVALRVAAPSVRVVDATGAGDAFVGVLAAALADGAAPDIAMRRSVAAGSLACTGSGAQSSLPDAAAIAALLPAVAVAKQ